LANCNKEGLADSAPEANIISCPFFLYGRSLNKLL
jgi:hypothetical protein